MLQATFLHLPRVREGTERKLWNAGILSWRDFLGQERVAGMSLARKAEADRALRESERALLEGDATYFLRMPTVHHWRLYESFATEAVYLDIETDWRQRITVLGIFDGHTVKQFITGVNLTAESVAPHVQGKLLVTYNGASFDLPVIRRCLPGVLPEAPHFDLRHLAQRLGYRGGLKALEVSMGIRRPEAIVGMSGQDALHLWDLYRASGEESYLHQLLAYNEEDIVNLAPLARRLVDEATASFKKALRSENNVLATHNSR